MTNYKPKVVGSEEEGLEYLFNLHKITVSSQGKHPVKSHSATEHPAVHDEHIGQKGKPEVDMPLGHRKTKGGMRHSEKEKKKLADDRNKHVPPAYRTMSDAHKDTSRGQVTPGTGKQVIPPPTGKTAIDELKNKLNPRQKPGVKPVPAARRNGPLPINHVVPKKRVVKLGVTMSYALDPAIRPKLPQLRDLWLSATMKSKLGVSSVKIVEGGKYQHPTLRVGSVLTLPAHPKDTAKYPIRYAFSNDELTEFLFRGTELARDRPNDPGSRRFEKFKRTLWDKTPMPPQYRDEIHSQVDTLDDGVQGLYKGSHINDPNPYIINFGVESEYSSPS